MTTQSTLAIVLDLDWAPDWMIDRAAETLIRNRVKATWFVTHASAAVDRLKTRRDLFELGIHPNCLLGSTHGRTEDQVLSHMMKLVPGAVSMRTHGLYQSTNFLVKAARAGIRLDASLFLPRTPGIRPHVFQLNGEKLCRTPCIWEDDYEADNPDPDWRPFSKTAGLDGLNIFAFHPVHIALNTNSPGSYLRAKKQGGPEQWTEDFVRRAGCRGEGARTAFRCLAERLGRGAGGICLRDILETDFA